MLGLCSQQRKSQSEICHRLVREILIRFAPENPQHGNLEAHCHLGEPLLISSSRKSNTELSISSFNAGAPKD